MPFVLASWFHQGFSGLGTHSYLSTYQAFSSTFDHLRWLPILLIGHQHSTNYFGGMLVCSVLWNCCIDFYVVSTFVRLWLQWLQCTTSMSRILGFNFFMIIVPFFSSQDSYLLEPSLAFPQSSKSSLVRWLLLDPGIHGVRFMGTDLCHYNTYAKKQQKLSFVSDNFRLFHFQGVPNRPAEHWIFTCLSWWLHQYCSFDQAVFSISQLVNISWISV